MEQHSKLSSLFSKTIGSIRRQINVSMRKHTAPCWIYYLAYDYKFQGCESLQFTQRKLMCKLRSKSLESIVDEKKRQNIRRSVSLELKPCRHAFYIEFKDVYDIEYKCECDY